MVHWQKSSCRKQITCTRDVLWPSDDEGEEVQAFFFQSFCFPFPLFSLSSNYFITAFFWGGEVVFFFFFAMKFLLFPCGAGQCTSVMCILFALVPTAVSGSGYCFCVVDYIMSFNSASFLILDFNVEIPVVMYSDFFFFFFLYRLQLQLYFKL